MRIVIENRNDPCAYICCRTRHAGPFRVVFRHRSRAAETVDWPPRSCWCSSSFSIATIWPPQKKIALGLDIQGGTSFLIRLKGGDKEVTKGMLDQAVEVIRKRIDVFGVSEPIISPVGSDRILVQIPGLDTAKIQEARDQLSRVAKLEFRLVYPDNGERLTRNRRRETGNSARVSDRNS